VDNKVRARARIERGVHPRQLRLGRRCLPRSVGCWRLRINAENEGEGAGE